MCSVVGYIGKKLSRSFIVTLLERLEYRGYDSAGFACYSSTQKKILSCKAAGSLSNLFLALEKNPLNGYSGIGHTRWATHGALSEVNAHPHYDCTNQIAVVHNGIIENHMQLKKDLILQGHIFKSATDTEVVVHLFEQCLKDTENLQKAIELLVQKIQGSYALVFLIEKYPEFLIAIRSKSSLCLGIGDQEIFIASDLLAFIDKTQQVLFMPDKSYALIQKDLVEIYNFNGKVLPLFMQKVEASVGAMHKKGFEHFMLKEIYEQKSAVYKTIDHLYQNKNTVCESLGISNNEMTDLQQIGLVGCGSSWHAARIAQFFFESIAKVSTKVHLASELCYAPFFSNKKSLYFFVSQSGETADTLEALSFVQSKLVPTVAVTNVASSAIVRQAGGFLCTQAGQEIAVASTKAFSTQLVAFYWIAHVIAVERGQYQQSKLDQVQRELKQVADALEQTIEEYKQKIETIFVPRYAASKQAVFLGRGISYSFAMEAALKLKEISYIFAQAYPSGELKHGPLALIDESMPVFIFSQQDPLLYRKILSSAQESYARGGKIIAFVFAGQQELIALAQDFFIMPTVPPLLEPLVMTGIMQYVCYSIAKKMGKPIDKPRNLAKSVTVE